MQHLFQYDGYFYKFLRFRWLICFCICFQYLKKKLQTVSNLLTSNLGSLHFFVMLKNNTRCLSQKVQSILEDSYIVFTTSSIHSLIKLKQKFNVLFRWRFKPFAAVNFLHHVNFLHIILVGRRGCSVFIGFSGRRHAYNYV